MNDNGISRRKFVQLSASLGVVASLGGARWAQATTPPDYKALVCIFLFGGNDGHNMVVPLNSAQFAAYTAARGSLALPQGQLLSINDAVQGPFGLHASLPKLQGLYTGGQAAIVANVGMLAGPTTVSDYVNGTNLPSNLRSHSDQVVQMQTGFASAGGPSGWGGRAADGVTTFNTSSKFPVSISMNGPAIFCAGNTVPAASLQPGNLLTQNAMSLWPASAGTARAAAQQTIVTTPTGNQMVDNANRMFSDALDLRPMLQQAQAATSWNVPFPSSSLGKQLGDIARLINLHSQLSVGRQVFFASLGGFDTHSGQSYQQGVLLADLDASLYAFYKATNQVGVDGAVTAFTMSDFGRTLQPSGSGTDHGWGSHHFVVGGGVSGARIYGQFPLMTNYANFNAQGPDYADTRGTLLPRTSLAQYGATLAKWFGADENVVFPGVGTFGATNLGFLG